MNISLIANTGIQFHTLEFEVKAEESFVDKNGDFLSPVSIKDENNFDVPLVFHESYDVVNDVWSSHCELDNGCYLCPGVFPWKPNTKCTFLVQR